MNLSRLNKFEFDQTQICEPNVLQSWLAEIPSLERTNTPCLSTVAECNNVSQIPQIECETLVTFYKNTNGAEWLDNTGWLQTNTPCSWFGVRCASIHVGQIRLVNNQLSGAIPAELSNLPKLQTLVLPENQLSGQIPAELGDLATLNILALHENQLSGQIPAELGNLIRLKSIHLHENQLSGQIPATLYNLPVLEKLYLHNNQMSGQIPAEISNLTALETLALHKNQFSGPIPTEIGNLTTLEILALHENQMSGQVPAEIGNLTRLRELYLHDNQFSGAFPAEISNLSSLSTFSIGGNQLTNGVVEIDTISEGDGTIERTIDAPFYAGGTSIELTAVPAEGWRFVRWIGPQISADLATQPTITIIAGQENETFTAYFAANTESEVAGDVNCNGILEIEDALFILQHHLEQRESSDCPLAGPNTLNVALGDVDTSKMISVQK